MMVELPRSFSATIVAIDAAVEKAECRDFDHVVRGSSIGHPCERKLWYGFRWAGKPEEFDGRKLRLFHTGHSEEERMIAWLRLAGVKVEAIDVATGEQWEVVALDGHFRGHLDGIIIGLIEAPKTPHLLECKTHNSKSFAQLLKYGVEASKPEHVAQMQIYMLLKGLSRGFYLAKNKDDDTLYAERVNFDLPQATALLAKADRIKSAYKAPARISDDPNYFLCKTFNCHRYGLCHGTDMPIRNCRTCVHSTPAPAGAWHCDRHDRQLSIDDQKAGCPNHLYLPSLIPGEQVDADTDAETITYDMHDGHRWTDGLERSVFP